MRECVNEGRVFIVENYLEGVKEISNCIFQIEGIK